MYRLLSSGYWSEVKMVKNMFTRNNDETEVQSAKTIAFVHYKGGTGKTTSCLSIAGWLVKMNKKVLVVDLDHQGNAAAGLGVDRRAIDGSIYDVLFGGKDIREIILETESGVFLVPSPINFLSAETYMARRIRKINNLYNLKEKLNLIKTYFDYILIDIPPASTLLMISGIVASEDIIIPLDSGVFAYEALEILKKLLIYLHKKTGIEVNIRMVLLRKYSKDTRTANEIKNLIKEFFKENNIFGIKLLTIPFSRKIHKAQMDGVPISHSAPHSNVGRAYKRIAGEFRD
jgi:chromosome partitioning protein